MPDMQRWKITIEYDGTQYVGWQHQKDGPSVQEELTKAIHSFSGQSCNVQGSGRTDAGVHARGQVAHFDLGAEREAHQIRDGLNHYLRDKDQMIRILQAEPVDQDFHARFSAKERLYHYLILNRPSPPALEHKRVWHVPYALDIDQMNEAAHHLTGHHDFSSFRAALCQAKSPIKTLDQLFFEKIDEDRIRAVAQGRSFLHHQVRNMVGTLKLVGTGKLSPLDVKNILEAKDRKAAGPTAPACGLYFMHVSY